jgi:excisionase family DNA binding protein
VEDLLTTRQLQDLLQVDRITIYRMLNDGRLRGFKIGGQWRFSRRDIDAWLQEQQSRPELLYSSSPSADNRSPSPQSLPLSCVEAILDICAEALGIAAVATDLHGVPLTKVSHSCEFCNLIMSADEGRRRCMAAWKLSQNGKPTSCHAGLLVVSAPIEVGGQLVAITSGCQFANRPLDGQDSPWLSRLPVLAAELDLNAQDLQAATSSICLVPEDVLPRISRLLQRMAGTFSEMGEERLNLLSRLQHIAEMSKV